MPTNSVNKNKETVQKSLRLGSDVLNGIEELARKENRTFNNMVETVLLKYVNEKSAH